MQREKCPWQVKVNGLLALWLKRCLHPTFLAVHSIQGLVLRG
jgi:hypothetical protein